MSWARSREGEVCSAQRARYRRLTPALPPSPPDGSDDDRKKSSKSKKKDKVRWWRVADGCAGVCPRVACTLTPPPTPPQKKGKDSPDGGDRDAPTADGRPRGDTNKGGRDEEAELDSIPIAKLGKLEVNALKSALDVSIFGDFGKGDKPSKKGKKGAAPEDATSFPKASTAKTYKVVMDDDDMPGGGADTDKDEPVTKIRDRLADVDLSTPLRDDETMPSAGHRKVADKAMGGAGPGGKGRARVLGGGDAPKEAAPKEKK